MARSFLIFSSFFFLIGCSTIDIRDLLQENGAEQEQVLDVGFPDAVIIEMSVQEKIEALRVGMTMDEVLAIFDHPNYAYKDDSGPQGGGVTWYYDEIWGEPEVCKEHTSERSPLQVTFFKDRVLVFSFYGSRSDGSRICPEHAVVLFNKDGEEIGRFENDVVPVPSKRRRPATTVTATPPAGSEVAANATIALAFDQPVESVAGATGSGKNWTVPVQASLSITWTNKDDSSGGPVVLAYKLRTADKRAPKVSGGNVKNGAKDVDPRPLNQRGIVIEFSEVVGQGTAELKPEGGQVMATEAKWEGKKVTLTLLAGKTLGNETTYVITIGGVKDGAGNALEGGRVKFTTKGKE